MWTLPYHVLSTIFNSTGGRKAVSSSDVYLLTPKMENDAAFLKPLSLTSTAPPLAIKRHGKPAIKRKETETHSFGVRI